MPFIEIAAQRILFLHIPKTGGTSIETWLSSIAPLQFKSMTVPKGTLTTPQHFTYNDIFSLLSYDYFTYMFTIVRDPYARLESEFYYHLEAQGERFFKAYPTFQQWVVSCIKQSFKNPTINDNHLRPQYEFIGPGVTVFRFEEGIGSIITYLAEKIGVPKPTTIPHEKKAKQHKKPVVWTEEAVALVTKYYETDFSLFEYSTDISVADLNHRAKSKITGCADNISPH